MGIKAKKSRNVTAFDKNIVENKNHPEITRYIPITM